MEKKIYVGEINQKFISNVNAPKKNLKTIQKNVAKCRRLGRTIAHCHKGGFSVARKPVLKVPHKVLAILDTEYCLLD